MVVPSIAVFVPGVPVPQPRPRVNRSGSAWTPGRVRRWKAAVADELRAALGREILEGPVQVRLEFRLPVPARSERGVCSARCGDVDNLAKGVLDAITDAGVWQDDRNVVRLLVTKVAAPGGRGAGVWISATTAAPASQS